MEKRLLSFNFFGKDIEIVYEYGIASEYECLDSVVSIREATTELTNLFKLANITPKMQDKINEETRNMLKEDYERFSNLLDFVVESENEIRKLIDLSENKNYYSIEDTNAIRNQIKNDIELLLDVVREAIGG